MTPSTNTDEWLIKLLSSIKVEEYGLIPQEQVKQQILAHIQQEVDKKVIEASLNELDYHKRTADSIIKGIKFSNNSTYYINRAIEVDTRIAKNEKRLAELNLTNQRGETNDTK